MIGQRIAELRKLKKMSQYELAEKLSMSRGQLANYEQGQREPDFTTAEKIADFFGVSVDFLLGRSDVYNPSLQESDEQSQPEIFDVYADPEGWIELLAAEYQEKNGRPLEDWKKKAILELLETNKQK